MKNFDAMINDLFESMIEAKDEINIKSNNNDTYDVELELNGGVTIRFNTVIDLIKFMESQNK